MSDARVIFQYDAMDNLMLRFNGDIERFKQYAFEYFDLPGSRIDTVFWDCAYGNYAIYPSQVLPPNPYQPFCFWQKNGFDFIEFLVAESRKRKLGVFWNFRVSEVDLASGVKETELLNPLKRSHPEWLLKTWWPWGLWNYAHPDARQFRADVIHELADKYDFDGFQIDFARHLPVLPVGRQWELRESVTDFLRLVRRDLQALASRRRKPFYLAAKVNPLPEDRKEDGFDVEAWIQEGLVDMLTLGSRSFEVDFNGWRALAGKDVKLFGSVDEAHYSDGYGEASAELLRGVTDRFLCQGADGLLLFNWLGITPDSYRHLGYKAGSREIERGKIQTALLPELGSRKLSRGRDKSFPVERRGNYMRGHYHWCEGALNGNLHAQLPLRLPYADPARVVVQLSDDFSNLQSVTLQMVLSNMLPGDKLEAKLNHTAVVSATYDHEWKDTDIFAPSPEIISGVVVDGAGLTKVTFLLNDMATINPGRNVLEVAIGERSREFIYCREIYLEKIELHLAYRN